MPKTTRLQNYAIVIKKDKVLPRVFVLEAGESQARDAGFINEELCVKFIRVGNLKYEFANVGITMPVPRVPEFSTHRSVKYDIQIIHPVDIKKYVVANVISGTIEPWKPTMTTDVAAIEMMPVTFWYNQKNKLVDITWERSMLFRKEIK